MIKRKERILSDFIKKAAKASDIDGLCQEFSDFLNNLHFKGFFYTSIPSIPRKRPDVGKFFDTVLLHCTDQKALDSLIKSCIFGGNPILIRLVTGDQGPFTPYEAFKAVTGKPPGRPEEILEDPSVAYSLVCALDSPDRRCGLILMSRYHNPLKLRLQLSIATNTAYAGSVFFHERWKAIVNQSIRIKLSLRECECLLWAAQGKTAAEIAILLSISESTVRFHFKNASAKLDTVNTTHAVALAIAHGLIPANPFD